MRRNRKQCLAILLSLSLLTSMAPSPYIDASAVDNSRSVQERTVSISKGVDENVERNDPSEMQKDNEDIGIYDPAATE